MSPAGIARALGGRRTGGRWWLCRCPAHDDRTPSLSLCDGDRGPIVRCWAGCDPRDVMAALRQRGLLGETGAGSGHRVPTMPTPAGARDYDDAARRVVLARRIWDAAQDARGSLVARYLAARHITIPAPPSLRWAPRCWHRAARAELPAMVARVDDLDGGLIGVHRTYLARDHAGLWRRRDRASLGPIGGGAVRLAPATETMMVAEGIETCLAAMLATGMPGWAALSTSGLVALVLPPTVRAVIILVDHDRSGAGERAANTAAARWLSEGRRVWIAIPPEPDSDFNDVLLRRGYAPISDGCDVAA